MWERVKSSSPKFLYQTSDSANHHSAIIKLSQCNYKNQDFCQTLSLCNWESSFDEQASAESQLCQSFPLVQSCPEFVKQFVNTRTTFEKQYLHLICLEFFTCFFTDENQTDKFSTKILSYHHHHCIVTITIVFTVLGVVINIIVLSPSVPPTGLQILEKPTYVSEGKSRVVTCQVSFLNMLIIMMTMVMEDGLMLIDDTVVSGHMHFSDISTTVQ